MELAEISQLVDDFHHANQERLAADREAAALKRYEEELKQTIIGILHEQGMYFVAGKEIRVKLQVKEKPVASNWNEVYQYMKDNDAMDLCQKRLHFAAIADRIEEGETIPGIEFVEVNNLSIGKL